ncbi:MAG: polyphenol oxidase family protein [Alphaproteobacteria bacterium]|nr:polyphenol oxidase family protein [Alphaproteobacteria bacterium]MBM3625726.1 polyphenol oxidase family protein [Alphaproteobacteria bacterium]MBM3640301.1 polyphenol oxidase family protein [Alphaproteobacteria bacterium]
MTLETPALTARNLSLPGLRHAFFTREGGVSEGVYASLNGGVGSRDAPPSVAENRARMAARLGVESERLLVPFQIHSADAVSVREPWSAEARPRCDGVVTTEVSLALGVTGADCGMLLFADVKAGVIGACHAGWKGALGGVIEATVTEMEAQGARRADIHVALGPAIGATSYEVGPEFVARFRETDESFARFFTPTDREGHATFDLPGFIASRVEAMGAASFEDLGVDTYADEARCFSYRRSVHRREPDYGRLVSAITLL